MSLFHYNVKVLLHNFAYTLLQAIAFILFRVVAGRWTRQTW